MSECIKYNPENHSPELFLKPPTMEVGSELIYLSNQIEKNLTQRFFKPRRTLLIGTEFEVLFFSKESDPGFNCPQKKNPNYFSKHMSDMQAIIMNSNKFSKENRLFWSGEHIGRLAYEYRTAPLNVAGYLRAVAKLSDYVSGLAKSHGVIPVVHSQHIHMSLTRHGLFEDFNETEKITGFDEKTKKEFLHILPFVVLPEEYSVDTPYKIIEEKPHWKKRKQMEGLAYHPEYKLLSSEYACDPLLNLSLCLKALYATTIKHSNSNECLPKPTYLEDVGRAADDAYLSNFFGLSTLHTLCNIVSQYPEVSTRKIMVNQIQK